MPYAWTHLIFGDEVVKKNKPIRPKNKKNFHLGCLGPDFLFFYRFWPWLKSTPGTTLGDLFHTTQCGPIIIELITRAKEKISLRDYVAGFITHHILDRNTHPFIHYYAGYAKYKHQELEVILDTLIAEKLRNISTWNTPIVPHLDVGHSLPQEVAEELDKLASIYYPDLSVSFSISKYHQAYRDMKRFLELTFDPSRIKSILTFGMISPFRYAQSHTHSHRDYFNLKRETWIHPAIADEIHHESFWDLWEIAMIECTLIFNEVNAYWNCESATTETLCTLIQDISYDTGKACSSHLRNHIADPIV